MTRLDDCGCCGRGPEQRPGVWNSPGLSRIGYRIDRFGAFKRSMLDALNRQPGLGRLATRDDSDASIALIDAWSTVLDVLTFYQEQAANEHYLRTATEHRSLLELGSQVGYRLAPGTAATAYLAFKLDDSAQAPESARLDAGTKIQSQPGQDELPQVYETLETVVGYPAYNAMPVRKYAPDKLAEGRASASFEGSAFDVKIGDTLLFAASASEMALAKVTEAKRDDERRSTWLAWTPALPDIADPEVFILRLKAAIFGYNAIDYSALPLTLTIGDVSPKDGETFIEGPYAGQSKSWADAALTGDAIDLDSLYPSIAVGSWVVLQNEKNTRLFKVDATSERVISRFMLTAKVTHLDLDQSALEVFTPRDTVVLAQSEKLQLHEAPIPEPLVGKILDLDAPPPEKGRKLLVVGKRPYAVLAKGGGLQDRDGTKLATLAPNAVVRVEEAPRDGRFLVRTKEGTVGWLQADENAVRYLPAHEDDPADQGEIVETVHGFELARELKHAYDRASSVVYGNVAFASHGESRVEVLGSGSAVPFLKFELREKPLTYLAGATETGYESTLRVRVNDVLWSETPTLLGCGTMDRVYTAREDDRLATRVQFGDGVAGARPESGVENIVASYRKGSGLVGRVRAGQLNMLLTRPLGVIGVTNPLVSSGGTDPESARDAKLNIPRSALTLGRIVSVRDFEDHAARFPGVAKAQAVLLWNGTRQAVHLTVAGPEGEAIDPANLAASIDSVRDARFPFVLDNVEIIRFAVALEVLVKPGFLSEKVFPAVQARIREAFGFSKRLFSEAVTASQILAEVQEVEGVEAANLTGLGSGDDKVLRIKPARSQGGVLLPAQMLLVDDGAIEIKEMKRDL